MGGRENPLRERRMHVMLCYSIYPPIQAGGAELIVSYLAEGLVKRGLRVTVVSTCGPEMEPYPTESRGGVEVIRFFPKNRYWLFDRQGRRGLDKLRWHVRDAWNRASGRRLRNIMSAGRPDIVHSHGVEGFSPMLWRSAKSLGIPVVHTAHDYYMMCPRAMLLTRRLAICTAPTLACRVRSAWYLRCGSAIELFCSPSQFLLDKHVAAGLPTKLTAVVPNGIPTHPRKPRTVSRDAARPLRVLFAGRLTAEKGLLTVIAAMRHIPRECAVVLTIAGKGLLEDDVRVAAAEDPRISFAGYLSGEEKDQAFTGADCLLLPSLWYENAPVVILEAAAYGLPVIGSRLGAIPEFVEDGVNGLLVEAGNPQLLAAAMIRLASDRALLEKLAAGGAPLIAKHSIAGMLDQYLYHYSALLRNKVPAIASQAIPS
jgi:glycosyltransferase involved in cell wall biosynthesis